MLEIIRKIYSFSDKRKKELVKSIIANIMCSIFEILQFVCLFLVINGLLNDTSQSIVGEVIIIMCISIAGRTITNYIGNLAQTKAGYFMVADKRVHIGERLKYISMGYFNKNNLGNITATVTTSLSEVENNAPIILATIVDGIIYTTILSIALLIFDSKIGIICALGILIYSMLNRLLLKSNKESSSARQLAQGELVEAVMEYIQGMTVVKSFSNEENSNKRVEKAIKNSKESNISLGKSGIGYVIAQEVILRGLSLGIMIYTIFSYLVGNYILSETMLLLIMSFTFFSKLELTGSSTTMLRMLDESMDRASQIDQVPLIDVNGKNAEPSNYNITFENVEFSYEENQIIKEISFTVPENTTTAIIGPSGSGKSTICNLLARFWDVDSGRISIGGIDIREYTMDSLMKNISIVFQDVYLFSDTIENNIKFGRPDATYRQVIEAAKKASCYDFIMELPDKFDTIINEGGSALSGGERQRISIARAILKDAPIIILDEATANLDPENEEQLQFAIEELINKCHRHLNSPSPSFMRGN